MNDLWYAAYLLAFAASIIIGGAVGIYYFDKSQLRKRLPDGYLFYIDLVKYAFVLAMVLVVMDIKNFAEDNWLSLPDYTWMIFGVEGNAAAQMQQYMQSPLMDPAFKFIYLYIFAYLLIFVPFLYLYLNKREALQKYSLAVLLNYLILMPFYIFIPVLVTSMYPASGAEPVLYSDEYHLRFVLSIDRLDDSFPSGHVSMSVIAFLSAKKWGGMKRFEVFTAISAFLVVISVVYLGIHWLIDIAAGLIVAIVVVRAAELPRLNKWYENALNKIWAPINRRANNMKAKQGK